MTSKPTSAYEIYRLINLSLALGFLSFMAMNEAIPISPFVTDTLHSIPISEPASNVSSVCLNWWLPSSILFALFRFTKLLDWLTFNRLTQWAFLIANAALLIEMASYLLFGRPSYFTRVYFEAPWKIGLMIGGLSLIGCTVWYQLIKRNSIIRNMLTALLSAEYSANSQT